MAISAPDEVSILQGDNLSRLLTQQDSLHPGVLRAQHQDGLPRHIHIVCSLGYTGMGQTLFIITLTAATIKLPLKYVSAGVPLSQAVTKTCLTIPSQRIVRWLTVVINMLLAEYCGLVPPFSFKCRVEEKLMNVNSGKVMKRFNLCHRC